MLFQGVPFSFTRKKLKTANKIIKILRALKLVKKISLLAPVNPWKIEVYVVDECSQAHALIYFIKMNECHPNGSCANTQGFY